MLLSRALLFVCLSASGLHEARYVAFKPFSASHVTVPARYDTLAARLGSDAAAALLSSSFLTHLWSILLLSGASAAHTSSASLSSLPPFLSIIEVLLFRIFPPYLPSPSPPLRFLVTSYHRSVSSHPVSQRSRKIILDILSARPDHLRTYRSYVLLKLKQHPDI